MHPYFKRPGKGHNHDCCDSCGEGGALICCDSCPASFHLQCHDPPLEDIDIPEGDWICIKCFAAKPDNQKLIEAARVKSKSPVKTTPGKSGGKSVERTAGGGVAPPPAAGAAAPVARADKEWRPGGKGKKIEVSKPVRATRLLKKTKYADNSTEDEESEEAEQQEAAPPPPPHRTYKELYIEHIVSKPTQTAEPFSLLLKAIRNENATEFELPKDINVPETFPYSWKWSTDEKRQRVSEESKQKLCYVCCKSSRLGPMVSCDYCPLSFHLDCLDPPMSEIPRDVWMCPNHVETFLDTRLRTTSVTERVQLWDRHARQPVDTNAVKLQFMKRCQRVRRDERFGRRAGRKVALASSRKVAVPGYVQSLYRAPPSLLPGAAGERWHRPAPSRDTAEMEWVTGLVSLQTDLLKTIVDTGEKKPVKAMEKKEEEVVVKEMEKTEEEDIVKEEEEMEADLKCDESLDARSGEDGEEDGEDGDLLDPELAHAQSVSPSSTLSTCSLSPRHTAQLHQLDQRQLQGAGPQLGSVASLLAEHLAAARDLDGLDPAVVRYLASRHLATLSGAPGRHQPPDSVRARATLTPLHSRRAPAAMTHRSLSVGLGPGCGLDLAQYGHCNHLAARHATIFYDELSDCYELLNYAVAGTRVDQVLYGLDTAAVTARFPGPASRVRPEFGGPEAAETVMARPRLAAVTSDEECGCYCDAEDAGPAAGCEGSALLRHGSLLQFGCLQFVFSLAETGREL